MSDQEDGISPGRINRRQAMKAGLGGAAAAVALSAPNIEHFSLAPDVASASSQCAPGSTVNGSTTLTDSSKTAGFCITTNCWGSNSGCTCTNQNIGTITVPVASGQYTAPQFSVTDGGQVSNTNGTLSITSTNFTLNKPYSKCVVNVAGACTGGTPSGTFTLDNGISAANTFTSNTTMSGRMYCNGGVLAAGNITVSVTCTCGPN